jgi:hypothetical protein
LQQKTANVTVEPGATDDLAAGRSPVTVGLATPPTTTPLGTDTLNPSRASTWYARTRSPPTRGTLTGATKPTDAADADPDVHASQTTASTSQTIARARENDNRRKRPLITPDETA